MTLMRIQMTFTKKKLVDAYVTALVENMELSDLMAYACDDLQEHFSNYTMEELVAEVDNIVPRILAEVIAEFETTNTNNSEVTQC